MKFKVGDKVILVSANYRELRYTKFVGTIMTLVKLDGIYWITDQMVDADEIFVLSPYGDKFELATPYINERKLRKKLGLE